jgi:hypothetical protein|tara:strand:+ start:358 stop:513 length:156 start_codon:yes stop_codon:yes gene_type:complete
MFIYTKKITEDELNYFLGQMPEKPKTAIKEMRNGNIIRTDFASFRAKKINL